MSVQTRCDDHLDSAKEHIRVAILELNGIVVEEDWGWDEYTPEYFNVLRSVHINLLEIRLRLRRGGKYAKET